MSDIASRMEIAEGDITKLDVDAIVNAANTSLLGGGGVDGAIHRAAGPELLEACRLVGRCPTGEARLTRGYRLKARHAIHAVGPVWRGGKQGEDALLAAAYRNSLEIAAREGLETIAFPAISTGVYAFPLERATKIAVKTVADFLRAHDLPKRVVFCCFGSEVTEEYRRSLVIPEG
jgi:O-acetyl-ADP-ribose deacetylase (regulator of RNase III)